MGKVKIIKASAGSGKTFRLAYEYILRLIRDPLSYKHILAVTFTNKATEEMKRRILTELNTLANGAPSDYMAMLTADTGYSSGEISRRALDARTGILHDYSRFSVLTIDKFFQRIIRSFVKELGIDLNFNLELQTDSLVSKTADTLIDRLGEDGHLRRWISEYIEERIEGNQRWDIKSGVVSIARELFREDFKKIASQAPEMEVIRKVLKEAGDKYRNITTAMRSGAGQALRIIEGAGLSYEDFAFGKSGVGGYIAKVAAGRIEGYGSRVEKALESNEAWCARTSPLHDSIIMVAPHLREKLAAICSIYRENCRFISSYELLKDNYRRFALLGSLAVIMEEICAREGILPISETNNILDKLISGNDSPFIFEKAGNHFDTFMIDEFQDTSGMQWVNFMPLLGNALSQSEITPVLLVGDVKQSIYRWRGGDWRILAQGAEERFENTDSETLETNWRSRPALVEFNNYLIGKITDAAHTAVNEALEEAQRSNSISAGKCSQLGEIIKKAYSDHGQRHSGKGAGGHVTVTYYGLSGDDAIPPVIRQIEELQDRGFRAGDIAVLVRRNQEGAAIADILLKHKTKNSTSKYCYDVVTQEALFIGASRAVNFIISCFRLSEGDESIPGKVQYNRFLNRDFGAALPEKEAAFLSSLRSMPPLKAFEETVIFYGMGTHADTAYLQALHDQILGWTATRIGDLPMFVRWWDENGAGQCVNAPWSGNAITIVSIHKSKGLEYPAVIIPHCDWNLAPRPQSLVWTKTTEGGFEKLGNVPVPYVEKMGRSYFSEGFFDEFVMSCVDNINLFYVAATRARDELHIMIPKVPKQSLRISSLIKASLDPDNLPEHLEASVTAAGEDVILKFGRPVRYSSPTDSGNNSGAVNLPFRSYPNNGRMKRKRTYQRFEEEGISPASTPRDQGILLHSIFETALDREDIFTAIKSLEVSGQITCTEMENLELIVKEALRNETVSTWFDGRWDKVYNEKDIMVPGSPFRRRPDRVMESKEEIVVVDYKFGSIRDSKHTRQVSHYKNLLGEMSGKKVSGYIWYVGLNEVVEVA
ncbi:MAG: UvrD-helicase domain-containing protein [Rikenellaceae bacterium]|nr:UvrD-helicase domain-containing protein [Rikenellaceae bacterium]